MPSGMYVDAPEYREIAVQLKRTYGHHLGNLNLDRIGFLKELEKKPKSKLAITKKMDDITKALHDTYDYVIIVYERAIEEFVPAQKNILIFHELLHCDFDGEKLIRHDVMDFSSIIIGFGVDWAYNPAVTNPLVEKVDLTLPKNEQNNEEILQQV